MLVPPAPRSLLGLALLGFAACGTDDSDSPPDPTDARATWYQDVAPIVAKHCMTCHQDGGIGAVLADRLRQRDRDARAA